MVTFLDPDCEVKYCYLSGEYPILGDRRTTKFGVFFFHLFKLFLSLAVLSQQSTELRI